MNRRIAAAVFAAGLLGGTAVVIVPQHAVSIVRLLAAAVAVVVAGLVLLAVVPVAARPAPQTPLDRRPSRGAAPLDPPGLRAARRDLGRSATTDRLPAAMRQRLRLASAVRLQDVGIDLDDPQHLDRAADRLGSRTWKLLQEPTDGHRPTGRRLQPAELAATVHRILDDLDHPTGAPDVHR